MSRPSPILVLASTSPRRRELLERLGVAFECAAPRPGAEDEVDLTGASPREVPIRLALAKAADVVRTVGPERLVVGADTVVVAGDTILGKPSSRAEALQMLEELAGREHEVMTGVCVLRGERQETAVEVTRVRFCPLSSAEKEAYVDTGEPFDKAGGYGIQGRGSLLVERIEGCYFNVVGLPLVALNRLLKPFGLDLLLRTTC